MKVTLANGSQITCQDQSFAEGGDGTLYLTTDRQYVVKLYKSPEPWRIHATEAILNRYNVVRDHTYWEQFFAWPDAMVTQPSLGIRMRRVVDQRPLSNYINWKFRASRIPPQEQGTWQGYVAATIKVTRLLRRLHQFGLCHSDLSENNIFINPMNGQVTLLDCDGLVVPGALPPVVLGTKGYMAPELADGSAKPSIETDRHALAVIIYRTLLLWDPFKGPKKHHNDPTMDETLMYGKNALFIEHPTDRSNRPNSIFPSIAMLGPEMQKLFQNTFVDFLHTPNRRPHAAHWERALIRMYDQVVPCSNPKCPFKSFVLLERTLTCPWCNTPLRHPSGKLPVLYLYKKVGKIWDRDGNYMIAGNDGRTIHSWQVSPTITPGPDVDPYILAQICYDAKTRTWRINNYALNEMRRVTQPPHSEPLNSGYSFELQDGDLIVLGNPEGSRAALVKFLALP